jgi:hypothetical protein
VEVEEVVCVTESGVVMLVSLGVVVLRRVVLVVSRLVVVVVCRVVVVLVSPRVVTVLVSPRVVTVVGRVCEAEVAVESRVVQFVPIHAAVDSVESHRIPPGDGIWMISR